MKNKKIKASFNFNKDNDVIVNTMAKTLQEEIDAEVMRQTFKESGWHEVVLDPMTWEDGYSVDAWVDENIKGNMWTHGLVWLFKEERDANWFSMRWLG